MSVFSPEEQKLLVQAEYDQFLREKIKLAAKKCFDVSLDQINPHLKPHTRDIMRWALAGGQRLLRQLRIAQDGHRFRGHTWC